MKSIKDSYPDEIMLCFIQGYRNGSDQNTCRNNCLEYESKETNESNNTVKLKKKRPKKVSLVNNTEDTEEPVQLRKNTVELVTGKSLRLSSGDRFPKGLPEVKRSFSDRFSVTNDVNGKRPRGFLTIRKTWSTGNFAPVPAGGGCGAPRSAPATPLQLDAPRPMKTDKHAVAPLSTSVPSVRDAAAGSPKPPSKARQKKFLRHFPQVGPEERVLNYYSCALVGDILLQGHLYITKNYFAFYSNVFGYVTKLLIPTSTVLRVTKEKMARIIPNAVGVCTRDERHVFGSLLSRDATLRLMTHVWRGARPAERPLPPQPQELRISEAELDASSLDESSSAGGDGDCKTPGRVLPVASAAVIQPALLTGAPPRPAPRSPLRSLLLLLAALLLLSAAALAHRLHTSAQDELSRLSAPQLFAEVARWRARLHGRAAAELHTFLTTNLMLLTKVRQSLEALSGVILTDMAQDSLHMEVPNDTTLS